MSCSMNNIAQNNFLKSQRPTCIRIVLLRKVLMLHLFWKKKSN